MQQGNQLLLKMIYWQLFIKTFQQDTEEMLQSEASKVQVRLKMMME